MYYEINLKKLNKIIGEEISWEGFVLNEKTLKKYVTEGDVMFDDLTPIEDKILKNAAQLVINNKVQRIEVELNFGSEQGLPTNMFKNWTSISQFLASKYLGEENIVCNIEGEKNVVDALVGKFSKEIQNYSEEKVKLSGTNISWKIEKEILVNSWGDREYVLNQIKKSNDDNIENTFKTVSKELWEDISFLQEVLIQKAYSVERMLPSHVLNGDNFLTLICQDMRLFSEKWSDINSEFKEVKLLIENELVKNGFESEDFPNPTSLLANLNILNKEKFNEDIQNKIIKVEKIWVNVFNDKDKCLKILNSTVYGLDSAIEFFSPNIQLIPEIIDKTFSKCVKKEQYSYDKKLLHNFVPPEYFKDEEQTMSFLQKYINGCFNGNGYFKEVPKYIRRFYENKEENALLLLDRATEFRGVNHDKICSEIYSGFSEELKESKSILKKLIELKDPMLVSLSEKYISEKHITMIKKDKEIQNYILEQNHYQLFSILPSSLIYQLKNKEDIIGVVKKNYDLLNNAKTPKEWREDIDIVTSVGSDVKWIGLTKTELKKLAYSEENAIKLINCNYRIAEKFPKEMRQNKNVGVQIISKITNTGEGYSAISLYVENSLWANYDFCYKALGMNKNLITMVPNNYWNNGDFIKGLFKNIDNGAIGLQTIELMPVEIKQCLDSFGVEVGGLEKFANQFFSKQILQQTLAVGKSEINPKKLKL
jgi:hypothetical protein